MEKIADDELRHYHEWKELTGEEVKPDKKKIVFYVLLSLILGLTFAIKLMERGEENAEKAYEKLEKEYPVAADILKDEFAHEQMLINLIEEERLKYVALWCWDLMTPWWNLQVLWQVLPSLCRTAK